MSIHDKSIITKYVTFFRNFGVFQKTATTRAFKNVPVIAKMVFTMQPNMLFITYAVVGLRTTYVMKQLSISPVETLDVEVFTVSEILIVMFVPSSDVKVLRDIKASILSAVNQCT
jgi:hypothetical protein